ncbi:MAG: isopentenyl phosphate kinase [Candidatus Hodarchaeales archaeon]|jgi:isopentenyl phosphate kinase
MKIDLIMKIGGSCISNKALLHKALKTKLPEDIKAALRIETELIDQIASEISEIYSEKKKMILLTGVGSQGHFTVLKHGLHKGDNGTLQQHVGFLEAQIAVNQLRLAILKALFQYNIPAVQLYASSIYRSDKMRIENSYIENLKLFLDVGMVPVISGDMVPDKTMGLSVLSGDQILLDLAKEFQPKLVIFGSDVDGVFTSDPKIDSNAQLLPEIPRGKIDALINETFQTDASGQMKGKLIEIKNLLNAGFTEIILTNLTKKGNLVPIIREYRGTFTRFY